MSLYESKKLKEEHGEVVAKMHELGNRAKTEDRAFSSDEIESYDKLADLEADYRSKIDTLERIEKVSNIQRSPEFVGVRPTGKVTKQDQEMAFRAVCLREVGQTVPVKWMEAAERCGITANTQDFTIRLSNEADAEERAQTVGTAGQGGNLTNSTMMPSLEKALEWHGGIRQACRVIRTETGSDLNWPTLDDTTSAASIVGENTGVNNSNLVFGQKVIKSYKWPSGVFPVSVELMQDALVPVASIVGEALGERISRIQNTQYTVGDGTAKPEGIVTASPLGNSTDGTGTLEWMDVVDLIHSVDVAYRNSPNFGLMMHDAVYAELLKLRDSEDHPLYLPSLAQSGQRQFLGYNIFINNDMSDSVASDEKIILAGDFSKGIVRDVSDIQVSILRERYADQLAVGFFAYARGDFKLIQTKAVKHLAVT